MRKTLPSWLIGGRRSNFALLLSLSMLVYLLHSVHLWFCFHGVSPSAAVLYPSDPSINHNHPSVSSNKNRDDSSLTFHNTGSRFLILSMDIINPHRYRKPEHNLASLSSSFNHHAYSRHHGYNLYRHRRETQAMLRFDHDWPYLNKLGLNPKDLTAHYEKSPLIVDIMHRYQTTIDWILWLDYDALFWKCNRSIESTLQRVHQFYDERRQSNHDLLSNHKNKSIPSDLIFSGCFRTSILNNGVMLVRNSQWSRRFFAKLNVVSLVFGLFPGLLRWWDQSAMLMLLSGFEPSSLCHSFNLTTNVIVHSDHPNVSSMLNEDRRHIDEEKSMIACILSSAEDRSSLMKHLNDSLNRWVPRTLVPTFNADQSWFAYSNILDDSLKNHIAIIPREWLNTYNNYGESEWIVHLAGERQRNRPRYIAEFASNSSCSYIPNHYHY